MSINEQAGAKIGFSSQSSEKLLQIMESLAKYHAPAKLQDIAESLGVTQSTTLRYLNTLINQKYVYKDEETLRYGLTWKICRLGHLVTSHTGIRDIAYPFLRELSRVLDAGVCLAICREEELFYLDVIEKPNNTDWILQRIGKSAPMHCTGSGKVLLTGFSAETLKIFAAKGLERITDKTITNQQELFNELEKVRAQGYAIDDEECELGIRCVSVPLYDYSDRIAAAFSLFGSVADVDFSTIKDRFVPKMLEYSRQISTRLGSRKFEE